MKIYCSSDKKLHLYIAKIQTMNPNLFALDVIIDHVYVEENTDISGSYDKLMQELKTYQYSEVVERNGFYLYSVAYIADTNVDGSPYNCYAYQDFDGNIVVTDDLDPEAAEDY